MFGSVVSRFEGWIPSTALEFAELRVTREPRETVWLTGTMGRNSKLVVLDSGPAITYGLVSLAGNNLEVLVLYVRDTSPLKLSRFTPPVVALGVGRFAVVVSSQGTTDIIVLLAAVSLIDGDVAGVWEL